MAPQIISSIHVPLFTHSSHHSGQSEADPVLGTLGDFAESVADGIRGPEDGQTEEHYW